MVSVFGSNIEGAYTEGHKVEAIYAGSTKVWPTIEPDPSVYYIRWWPKDAEGIFIMNGEAHYLQDYSGYYSGPFSTVYNGSLSSTISYIDRSAFKGTSIIAVETNLKAAAGGAFAECTSLKYVSMPYMYSLAGGAFRSCTALTDIELPELLRVPTGCFDYCTNLMNVSFAKCITIGDSTFIGQAFDQCWNLQSAYLPSCYGIFPSGFASCGLSTIELPALYDIQAYGFNSCSNLTTLILGSKIPSVGGSAFKSTPLGSGNGSIYVPISMLLAYKSDSYWSRYSNIIYPIPN